MPLRYQMGYSSSADPVSILSTILLICLSSTWPSINFLYPLPGCTMTVAGIDPSHLLSILGMNSLGFVSDNHTTSGVSRFRSMNLASL